MFTCVFSCETRPLAASVFQDPLPETKKATKGPPQILGPFVALEPGTLSEATAGFEPAHKGFAGPRRVHLGPYVVIASNPVKGFHFACIEKGQDPLPSFFLPGNKLTNRIVDWYT